MTMEIETFDSLWAYCMANERLVPMPSEWTELHGRLASTQQKPSGGMESSLAADSGSMGLHDPHREATSVPVIFERGANSLRSTSNNVRSCSNSVDVIRSRHNLPREEARQRADAQRGKARRSLR